MTDPESVSSGCQAFQDEIISLAPPSLALTKHLGICEACRKDRNMLQQLAKKGSLYPERPEPELTGKIFQDLGSSSGSAGSGSGPANPFLLPVLILVVVAVTGSVLASLFLGPTSVSVPHQSGVVLENSTLGNQEVPFSREVSLPPGTFVVQHPTGIGLTLGGPARVSFSDHGLYLWNGSARLEISGNITGFTVSCPHGSILASDAMVTAIVASASLQVFVVTGRARFFSDQAGERTLVAGTSFRSGPHLATEPGALLPQASYTNPEDEAPVKSLIPPDKPRNPRDTLQGEP